MSRKHKKAHDRSASRKFCDPGVCDCCQYIGEGELLCDKHMEIVVSDWKPTANYLMCQDRNKTVGGGAGGKEL